MLLTGIRRLGHSGLRTLPTGSDKVCMCVWLYRMARYCDLGNRIEAITMSPELDKKSYGCKKDLLERERERERESAKPWSISVYILEVHLYSNKSQINWLVHL